MRLTILELLKISRRLDQINKLIEVSECEDELEALDIEWDELMSRVKRSYKLSRIAESGLRVVV